MSTTSLTPTLTPGIRSRAQRSPWAPLPVLLAVAITGVILFGALHAGCAHAFELAVGELALTLVAVAGLSRLLPPRQRTPVT